ncbi:MAG TPA: hypothetical protein VNJ53_10290 [Gaiellaceae bacterium]|nr:hypothetical protein [Gaiellaceae bacterium]
MDAQARAARERKQKIFVAVGGLFLLALLAIQLPKLLGGSDSSATPPASPGTPTSEATSGPPPAPGAVAVALRDTDRPVRARPGTLGSFDRFQPKDPFVQQIQAAAPAGGGGKGEEQAKTDPKKTFTVDGKPVASVTVVSVNGQRQALVPGGAFPAGNPVFVLVAEQPAKDTVTIGVRGGAYEGGARTTKLRVGKPLVLVNTTTGARYRVVLIAVGDGSAAETDAPASAPTP